MKLLSLGSLVPSIPHRIAYGVLVGALVVLCLIHKFDQKTIEVYEAEKSALAQMSGLYRQSAEAARLRINEVTKQNKRKEKTVQKEIENAGDADSIGAADFIGMLCNQAAAGCGTD